MTRRKGNRRERQAEQMYQRAGYKTEICRGLRWGRTDWFGLFDVMAIKEGHKVRFAQVKSNQVSDVNGWIAKARRFCDPKHVALDYLVCHDYKGWRFIQESADGYETVFDERNEDCDMGEGLTEFLRHTVGAKRR